MTLSPCLFYFRMDKLPINLGELSEASQEILRDVANVSVNLVRKALTLGQMVDIVQHNHISVAKNGMEFWNLLLNHITHFYKRNLEPLALAKSLSSSIILRGVLGRVEAEAMRG